MEWDKIWKLGWTGAGSTIGIVAVLNLLGITEMVMHGVYAGAAAVLCFILKWASQAFIGMLDISLTAVPSDTLDLDWLAPFFTTITAFCPVMTYLTLFGVWTTYKVLAFSIRSVLRLIPGVTLGT